MSEKTPYHATAVAFKGRAVLIEGPSGSGKSDLALRMIGQGARLISDDYVILTEKDGRLSATPPGPIAGKLEIRGVGIEDFPYEKDIPVVLAVTLVAAEKVPRMPDPAFKTIAGVRLPNFKISGLEASAPDKILYLLSKK